MSNGTFLAIVVLVAALVAGVVYMHAPRHRSEAPLSPLHGGR